VDVGSKKGGMFCKESEVLIIPNLPAIRVEPLRRRGGAGRRVSSTASAAVPLELITKKLLAYRVKAPRQGRGRSTVRYRGVTFRRWRWRAVRHLPEHVLASAREGGNARPQTTQNFGGRIFLAVAGVHRGEQKSGSL
jgi:hypothetical protein